MDNITTESSMAENIITGRDSRQLIKELRFTRIVCMVSSVLTLCLLAGGILLLGRVRELEKFCEPVVEKVSQLDVESLNETLGKVNVSLETVDWEQVAEALGELDVDAINSAIEHLDTEELSESLKNLNDAVETVREIGELLSEKMKSLSILLGGLFHSNSNSQ